MQTDSDNSPLPSIADDVRACIAAYVHGAIDKDVLAAAMKGFALSSADATWEVLSLLDQYHRRGALDNSAFQKVKEQVNVVAFSGRPTAVGKMTKPAEPNGRIPTRNYSQHQTSSEMPSPDDTSDQLLTLKGAETNGAASSKESAAEAPKSNPPRSTREAALANSIKPGKILDGRFVIESALSFGRYTAVYRARDRNATTPNNVVALKLLLIATPDSWTQFEHEQLVAHRFSHPQLLQSNEMRYDGKLPFFTMELIEGNTLGDLLQVAPLRRSRSQLIIAKLVDALNYLHGRQLAHGDIHPDNVIISTADEVKLIDYGSVNYFGVDQDHDHPGHHADISAGAAASLPTASPYASCQRLAGEAAEPSDDIYSLSCIAYELLAGQHPFKRLPATKARALSQHPAPVAALPPQQWHTLQRGLAWERDDRATSVAEWFAVFSDTNDMAAKSTPTPETSDAFAPGRTDAMPRWTSSVSDTPQHRPPRRDAPPTSRRWLLILTTICSTVAVMVILQSELGLQLRSQLATQWAAIQRPPQRAATPSSPAKSIIAPASASQVTNDAPENNVAMTDHLAADASTSSQSSSMDTAESAPNDALPKSISKAAGTTSPIPVALDDSLKQKSATAQPENENASKTGELHGKISFSSDTFTGGKRDHYVPITINRTDGTAGKVTFVWWTEPGTAEEDSDYVSYGKKTEVLASGKRRITVFVPLVSDLGKSKGHVFFVNLGDTSNGLALGRLTRAKVVISDQE